VKRVVGVELEKLETAQTATISYRGKNPDLVGKEYTLEDVRGLTPEEQNDILGTQAGFGGEKLPAPQASLMAIVGRGIVEGKTEMILIVVGMFMGIALILMQVKSPMLISVGMYLPIDTSFAIFVGGLMKGLLDRIAEKRKLDSATREKMGNIGVLLASGLIAGEALVGLLFAGLAFGEVKIYHIFEDPSYLLSLLCILLIGWFVVRLPLRTAKS
jgi:hypothetical protein